MVAYAKMSCDTLLPTVYCRLDSHFQEWTQILQRAPGNSRHQAPARTRTNITPPL